MADTTIGWTNKVWNPTSGCTKVSRGCLHCYAETLTKRFPARYYPDGEFVPWTVKAQRESGQPAVSLYPDRLSQPLSWKKPCRIFVNSMSDLFYEDVPFEFIDLVFATMACCPQHVFQILTKRPARMLEYMIEDSIGRVGFVEGRAKAMLRKSDNEPVLVGKMLRWPMPHTWLGVSVEDQKTAEERIPLLLQTPTAVHFLSVEPMLERVDLTNALQYSSTWGTRIDWVIVSAESGPNRRPFDTAWVEDLVQQCDMAGVPVFVKQGSDRLPGQQGTIPDHLWQRKEFPEVVNG